ncbi:MAG: 2-oxoacid:acceptor oxidoreductase subunit alpha [Candidatus Peribacteraceae bacterium]
MNRVSIKIVGAQGQGVNSVGEMCAKGLKRRGYCVFGDREYMSLIKGGHSSYQLDISDTQIRSSCSQADAVVSFNHDGIERNLRDLKPGGILLHQTLQWTFKNPEDQKFLEENDIHVLYLPTEEILRKLNAKPILGNVLITSVVWALLSCFKEELQELVREQFGHKKDLLELNFACIEEGWRYRQEHAEDLTIALPEPDERWKHQLLLTGSQAMGLGIISAGCRVFASYPMTPASPLMTYLADVQKESGMVIKQAEDEITAVQMTVGAMHAGTRAATGTSGGGYDLMTETISLCGISETPLVIVLAQRPGPGTGLPTWTAQGDLLMAVHCGHGEFPRLVMSVSDAEDSFALMMEAFNFAEEYQIPVTVLTDKHTAEALYTVFALEQHGAVRRGRLVTDAKGLSALKSTDRYAPTAPDGISARWLPGSNAPTYCAQGYEHAADGSFDESAANAVAQMHKRMQKMVTLKKALPPPEFFLLSDDGVARQSDQCSALDLLLVGWGSTKGAILDAMEEMQNMRIGYLHYTYLWPLRTERLLELAEQSQKTVLIEGNQQGQLGMLLQQECDVQFDQKILMYDGRSPTVDNIVAALRSSFVQ